MEFTAVGQCKMRRLCEWLVKAGVDSVTIANPYIALWLKKNYPNLSLAVSVIAQVDSLKRAKFWEGLGVEIITFPGPVVNRNFGLIKLLRKSLKCKIQLIANNPCLPNCPTSANHHTMLSHASQSWHRCKGYVFDYYLVMCRLNRLKEPVNFIRSDWIRPEDVHIYEGLGVDSIKLVDRRAPADMILRITEAYLKRRYEGNLADLFPTFLGKTFNAHRGWVRKTGFLARILFMDPVKIIKLSQLLSKLEVFIDNRQLDGYLENIPQDCSFVTCQDCGYCEAAADKAVKIDASYRNDMILQYEKAIDMISKNSFFLGRV
jgi:collagenase-like PrtC family protease